MKDPKLDRVEAPRALGQHLPGPAEAARSRRRRAGTQEAKARAGGRPDATMAPEHGSSLSVGEWLKREAARVAMIAGRHTAHAELRELGHGWIVDLVETAPAPCGWRARLEPAGVEVRAELERDGQIHSAWQLLSLEQLEAFAGDRVAVAHVQRAIDRLSRRVLRLAEDHEAAVAHRRALRGTRGIL